MVRKAVRAGGVAALLVGAALLATPSPALAEGSCTAYITDGGHTAVGKCSGYLNTGTFRIVVTACYTNCETIKGPYAYLAGGTSTVTSYQYLTNPRIELGPAGGKAGL
jgi:hypothetical protein